MEMCELCLSFFEGPLLCFRKKSSQKYLMTKPKAGLYSPIFHSPWFNHWSRNWDRYLHVKQHFLTSNFVCFLFVTYRAPGGFSGGSGNGRPHLPLEVARQKRSAQKPEALGIRQEERLVPFDGGPGRPPVYPVTDFPRRVCGGGSSVDIRKCKGHCGSNTAQKSIVKGTYK